MYFYKLLRRALLDLIHKENKSYSGSFNLDREILSEYLLSLSKKFFRQNENLIENDLGQSRILVHGTLANLLNVNFRLGLISELIRKKIACQIDVLFPGFRFEYPLATQCFNAIGVYNFIFFSFRTLPKILGFFTVSLYLTTKTYFKTYAVESILSLSFKSVPIGDLVYDDILRSYKIPTYKNIDRKFFNVLLFAYFWIYFYNDIFTKYKYKYLVITHTVYGEYGILARIASMNACRVIETSDIHFLIFKPYTSPNEITYHGGIALTLAKSKLKTSSSAHLINSRFSGLDDQSDINKALNGKFLSRDALLDHLMVTNYDAKNVIIMLHVFDDSPHTSGSMLHLDYYEWFVDTLNIIRQTDKVNWFFKIHPGSSLDDRQLILKQLKQRELSNIFLFPSSLSSKSLVNFADCLVTVQGTAALEFACFGIPSITTGLSFYHDASFTTFCRNRDDYVSSLETINKMNKLSPRQINDAITLFNAWHKIFQWNDEILTSQIINDLRQYDSTCDPNRGLINLHKNLKKTDLNGYSLTKRLRESLE
jgi:hypothetical protein